MTVPHLLTTTDAVRFGVNQIAKGTQVQVECMGGKMVYGAFDGFTRSGSARVITADGTKQFSPPRYVKAIKLQLVG